MACHNAMPVWRGRPRPRAGSIRAMAMPGFEAVTGGRKKTLPLQRLSTLNWMQAGRGQFPALEARGFCARIGDG